MTTKSKQMMGGHGKGKSKNKPHSAHIKRAHSGGFHVTHHFKPTGDDGMPAEDTEHVVPSVEALHDHIDQHFGDQQPVQMPQQSVPSPGDMGPGGPAAAPQGPPQQ